MADPRAVSVAYIEAVGQKQWDRVSALLHPDVEFKMPGRDIHGASQYIASLQRLAPILLRNEVKKAVVEGNDVCIVYDFVTDTAVGAVPSMEWLTIEDGRIRSVWLLFHSQPWPTVLEELARRSKSVEKATTNSLTNLNERPVTDVGEGHVVVSVDIAAPVERVFRALASHEVVRWWVRPGVFNTAEWTGDVRVGGRWRASGLFRGEPYATEGEFLEIDPPRRLVHTWHGVGAPGAPTTAAYVLEGIDGGTRLVLRHSGFTSREASANFGVGWETSFARLVEILATERKPSP